MEQSQQEEDSLFQRLLEYLKQHIRINIRTFKESPNSTTIQVDVKLDDKIISSDTDVINN